MNLVSTATLSNEQQQLATRLNNDKLPDEVWVVAYAGEFVALFLDEVSAFARLQHVIEGLKRKQLPVGQTADEIEILLMDVNAEPVAQSHLSTRRIIPKV
ncbi:hypothetical protein A0O30_23660 [Pseudomonas sp. LLC-1]|nr:hypothetical protein A0O30_23660 [Pseudomonas sp. LLC-1]